MKAYQIETTAGPILVADFEDAQAVAAERDQLRARAEGLENQLDHYRDAERDLGKAYLRLRSILGAFDTPHGPTAEQVWAHTEDRAKGLVAQLGKLREEASIWKGMHAVALEGRDQLRAQIERLKCFVERSYRVGRCNAMMNEGGALLRETPAQSLAEHDAALLAEVADSIVKELDSYPLGHRSTVVSIVDCMRDDAALTRKEAGK